MNQYSNVFDSDDERAPNDAPNEQSANMDWAIWLARRGLRVHPLHWPTKTAPTIEHARCSCNTECGKSKGKHPRLTGWQAKATTDERQIREWWLESPRANVGVYTGTGDLFVLDEDGEDGRVSRQGLERDHGVLPNTFAVSTGRGWHRYFAKSPEMSKIKNSVGIARGLDIRGDGGHGGNAVGPGSVHWSGRRYGVVDGAPIADPPPWLLTFVPRVDDAVKKHGEATSPPSPHEDDRIARIPMSERKRRAVAYVAKAGPAVTGERGHNVAMRVATAVVRGFALDADAAREVLREWSERCLPPWSDAELTHKIDEAMRVGAMLVGAKLIVGDGGRFEFRSASQIAEPRPTTDYLLPHFRIGPGRPTILGGCAGVGKTLLAQELELAVSGMLDRCWGDLEPGFGRRVVHIDYEMGEASLDERYKRLALGAELDLATLGDRLRLCSMPRLYLSSDSTAVEAALTDALEGVSLAVLDNLLAACPHAKSENDSTMRLYLDILTRVSLATECTIMILGHEGKGHSESFAHAPRRLRGSSAIVDAASGVLSVTASKGVLTIQQTKASLGPPGDPVRIRFVDAGDPLGAALRVEAISSDASTGDGERHVERAKTAILGVLQQAQEPLGVREVLKRVPGRATTKQHALSDLREQGAIVGEKGARGALLLRLAIVVGGEA